MKFILCCFYFVCLYLLPFHFQAAANVFPSMEVKPFVCDSVPSMKVNYKIITNKDHSYGYDIFVNGRLMVHQPVIPGMQGVKGFSRKGDAQKVARLVVRKIQNGLMPPTVEPWEIDSLRIRY